MFRLVLGCLVSDTEQDRYQWASEIRHLVLYNLGVLFILMWFITARREWAIDLMRIAM
jgi:hypothetical protein